MATFITAPNIAATIGLAATIMGTLVTLNPSLGIKMWHFDFAHTPSFRDPQTRSLVLDELRLFAIREMFIGASLVAASWFGDTRTLGVMCALGVPVVVVDGMVQRRQARGADWWVHFALVPVFGGLGWAAWRS